MVTTETTANLGTEVSTGNQQVIPQSYQLEMERPALSLRFQGQVPFAGLPIMAFPQNVHGQNTLQQHTLDTAGTCCTCKGGSVLPHHIPSKDNTQITFLLTPLEDPSNEPLNHPELGLLASTSTSPQG